MSTGSPSTRTSELPFVLCAKPGGEHWTTLLLSTGVRGAIGPCAQAKRLTHDPSQNRGKEEEEDGAREGPGPSPAYRPVTGKISSRMDDRRFYSNTCTERDREVWWEDCGWSMAERRAKREQGDAQAGLSVQVGLLIERERRSRAKGVDGAKKEFPSGWDDREEIWRSSVRARSEQATR